MFLKRFHEGEVVLTEFWTNVLNTLQHSKMAHCPVGSSGSRDVFCGTIKDLEFTRSSDMA